MEEKRKVDSIAFSSALQASFNHLQASDASVPYIIRSRILMKIFIHVEASHHP